MKLNNIKLSAKQRIALGLVLLFLTIISSFLLRTIETIADDLNEVTGNRLPRAIAIADLNLSTANLRMNQLQYTFIVDSVSKERQTVVLNDLIDQINKNIDIYNSLKTESVALQLYSAAEEKLYKTFEDKWDEYLALSLESIQLTVENKIQRANAILLDPDTRKIYEDFSAILVELVLINKSEAAVAALRAEKASKHAHQVTLIFRKPAPGANSAQG